MGADDNNGDTLGADEVTRYRRICRKGEFLGTEQDGHRVCHKGSNGENDITPAKDDWSKLVRLGRYLVRCPRVVNWYKNQKETEEAAALHGFRLGWVQKNEKINVRRMHPQRTAHAEIVDQDTSRGGSEFSGCSSEGRSRGSLGMMSLWKDVGETTWGHVMGDASAAVGITRRMER